MEFSRAFRSDKNTVVAIYIIESAEVSVAWSNIDPVTGEECQYYLGDTCHDVLSDNELLEERVHNAIVAGENSCEDDKDIYLFIRDTFDYMDCEDLI